MNSLPKELADRYIELKPKILQRLTEYSEVAKQDYFYELCFCICTPQSKAVSAYEVQKKLKAKDFLNHPFHPSEILNTPEHYIRFHNRKSDYLLEIQNKWDTIKEKILSNEAAQDKRMWIFEQVKGIGLKESAHYLRNIGFRDLAILDRHILKHLVSCGLFEEIPNISSKKKYLEVEKIFFEFSQTVGIPMDELDLLFWAAQTGYIFK